ncbi:hypothetical protein RM844_01710 [Streptomyces sp. DSM 44915]|uniref:Uncharacterized protein n=1 Tax=Streptomyces chisholmiae TaxID=3075540 RepID=A0ABU2JL68_9ACTN|nr:hypothetical protein [Streptomyces sp. DSM 44915]MDT0264998.1 hypothetical protein [Streptomyces sp. DSM 44915]
MDARMIEKAVFLLREAHTSQEETVHALARYFPGSAYEDRVRCTAEAGDLVHVGRPPVTLVASQVADARYFAAAHERHAFGD